MKCLQDDKYENYDRKGEDDRWIPAEQITCLAPYKYICDGFLTWECGKCGKEHSDRMFSTSGVVVQCGRPRDVYGNAKDGTLSEKPLGLVYDGGCGALNLLVRTNCLAISEALKKQWEFDEDWKANQHIKDILKFNDEQLSEVAQEISRAAINAVTASVSTAMQRKQWEMRKPEPKA